MTKRINGTDGASTTNTVAWNIPSSELWNTFGGTSSTTDISDIVQEIVDFAGWSTNDALVFVIEGTYPAVDDTGSRVAKSPGANGPVLDITFAATGMFLLSRLVMASLRNLLLAMEA